MRLKLDERRLTACPNVISRTFIRIIKKMCAKDKKIASVGVNIWKRMQDKEKFVRRHGGARRILSLELLGFKNLLSPASLYSRVNR